jgi:hypothetical protein
LAMKIAEKIEDDDGVFAVEISGRFIGQKN